MESSNKPQEILMKKLDVVICFVLAVATALIIWGAKVLWDNNARIDEGLKTVPDISGGEIRNFFTKQVEPIIRKLENGQYEISEIQGKYDFLTYQLKKMFDGRKVSQHNLPNYYKNISDVYSFSIITEKGDPVWGLVMPAVMDKAAQICGEYPGEVSEPFEVFVAVLVIHELSKLLYIRDQEHITEYDVEACVWAEICDDVILPLIENDGMIVDDRTFSWYFGWKSVGHEKNEEWLRFAQDQLQN